MVVSFIDMDFTTAINNRKNASARNDACQGSYSMSNSEVSSICSMYLVSNRLLSDTVHNNSDKNGGGGIGVRAWWVVGEILGHPS